MSQLKDRDAVRRAIEAGRNAGVTLDDMAGMLVDLVRGETPNIDHYRRPHVASDRWRRTMRWYEERSIAVTPPPPRAACVHCGTSFAVYRADARYCSARCRVAAKRLRDRAAS